MPVFLFFFFVTQSQVWQYILHMKVRQASHKDSILFARRRTRRRTPLSLPSLLLLDCWMATHWPLTVSQAPTHDYLTLRASSSHKRREEVPGRRTDRSILLLLISLPSYRSAWSAVYINVLIALTGRQSEEHARETSWPRSSYSLISWSIDQCSFPCTTKTTTWKIREGQSFLPVGSLRLCEGLEIVKEEKRTDICSHRISPYNLLLHTWHTQIYRAHGYKKNG